MFSLLRTHAYHAISSRYGACGYGGVVEESMISAVPEGKIGHVAFAPFILAKHNAVSPATIASDLVEYAKTSGMISADDHIASVHLVGPYCNICFDVSWLMETLMLAIQEGQYGRGDSNGISFLVEGWQPNTHKEFHIGHVRNALIPESLCRLMTFAGYTVQRCSYVGDSGAHVAKWLRYYTQFDNSPIPSTDVAAWASDIYARAGAEIDENPDLYKPQIHEIHKRLEDGDKEIVSLRLRTRDLCLASMDEYFRELGCDHGKLYLESEVEQPGIALVKEWQKKGIVHESQGALIIDMEDVDLGIFVVLKSNGASLYSTKDLALAYRKEQDFSFATSLYIVASEQTHHFNQVFEALRRNGYPSEKLVHLAYGMVELPDGKMSSRKGTAITYPMLRGMLLDQARYAISSRDLPETDRESLAWSIAMSAIKFSMLLTDTHKPIIFDPEKAVSFDGETGPYLLYCYARMASLLRSAEELGFAQLSDVTTWEHDRFASMSDAAQAVLLQCSQFPNYVRDAARSMKPNMIARYCFDLSQKINHRYHDEKMLTDQETASRSLPLVICAMSVLRQGLMLLGIETVEKM